MSDSTLAPPQQTSTANTMSTTSATDSASTTAPDAAPSTISATTSSNDEKTSSATTTTDAAAGTDSATTQTSSPGQNAGDGPSTSSGSGQQQEGGELTLRALVSSKEAGVIIGRGGATIATLRTESNVKAGVSKVVPGVADRILSVGGTTDGVAKAYSLVAQSILENPVPALGGNGSTDASSTPAASSTTIRLLISHLLIGSVIGKGGVKIRQIQDNSGARMVASKEMLPQSTERVVEVSGSSEAIRLAVAEIAKCLLDDWERSQGTVLYHPGAEGLGATGGSILGNGYPAGAPLVGGGAPFGGRRISGPGGAGFTPGGQRRTSGPHAGNAGGGSFHHQHNGPGGEQQYQQRRTSDGPPHSSPASNDPNIREQKIAIPNDMVGCIIGRGGTKINEIRRLSGSRISIAKTAHDETGERMFVISGLPENNEKALFLLYGQLESEKERRVQSVAEEDTAAGAAAPPQEA